MLKTRFLFIVFFILPLFVFGQGSNIQLSQSENLVVDVAKGLWRVKKPVFLHQGAIMTCDSAHYWKDKNYFEAFGNVNINQDTINISSDLLNYDGNTKEAHLIKNVKMSDPSSLLTTTEFFYNTATRIGRYTTNGKIVNKEATVTSKRGYYFASSNDAYFRENVVVTTQQVKVESDTLRYNTNTNETYFYGPTDIFGKTDTLYTENGQYNTKSQRFFAGKNNLYTQNTKTLRGDSLYYDGVKGYGKAVRNIVFTDAKDQLELHGQLGEYFKDTEKVRVQNQAYFAISTQDSVVINGVKSPDTLWLGAKVLEAEMLLQSKVKLIPKPYVVDDAEVGSDSPERTEPLKPNQNNAVKDSTKVELKIPAIDTVKTRVIKAFQGVKIFKNNLQAKADSLFFAAADSTLRLYKEPIIWSDSSQLVGDTINVQIRSKQIDNAQILQNAFISSQQADTTKFNQIKGKLITTFFEQGEIRDMFVDGNAESVIYEKTKDGAYNSNQTVSARIRLVFKNKELIEIQTLKVEGKFLTAEAKSDNIILTSFTWKPELRPKNKTEITGIRKPAVLPKKTSVIKKAPAKVPAKNQPTKDFKKSRN